MPQYPQIHYPQFQLSTNIMNTGMLIKKNIKRITFFFTLLEQNPILIKCSPIFKKASSVPMVSDIHSGVGNRTPVDTWTSLFMEYDSGAPPCSTTEPGRCSVPPESVPHPLHHPQTHTPLHQFHFRAIQGQGWVRRHKNALLSERLCRLPSPTPEALSPGTFAPPTAKQ